MDFKELIVYKKAFKLAMKIFKISKSFPKEEKYSLTDQIRSLSRSTCANPTESYRKRIYSKHFITKLTDSDRENSETSVWLDFALAYDYIAVGAYKPLCVESIEIGKLPNYMITDPDKFSSSKT